MNSGGKLGLTAGRAGTAVGFFPTKSIRADAEGKKCKKNERREKYSPLIKLYMMGLMALLK